MKKTLLRITLMFFLIGLIGFALNANLVFAQEIEYPEIPGADTPSIRSGIPGYVKYIFNFAILVSGFIALGVLIYAGFKYMTSVGSPEKIQDAKEQISAALLGMLILLSSYLILVKINPQLVVFQLPPITPLISTLSPGVLVCKERTDVILAWNLINEARGENTSIERKREIREQLDPIFENISENCYKVTGGSDIRENFDDWKLFGGIYIEYIYFIPKKEEASGGTTVYEFYGAIIYEDKNFGDESRSISHLSGMAPWEEPINTDEIKISSIRPFVLVQPEADHKTILYEETDFNFGGNLSFKDLPISTCPVSMGGSSDFAPQSIEIVGDYVVVLYEGPNMTGESEVFVEPGDRDLNNNRVACRQTCTWYGFPYSCKRSCVKSACAYGAKLY